jgi:hypothetical protein
MTLNHVVEDSSITNDSMIEDTGVTSNTEDDEEEEPTQTNRPRERRTSHIMDKIKMVFFEKRKSAATSAGNTNKNRKSNNSRSRQRPLSYPNLIDEQQGSSSIVRDHSTPLEQTLSRQSTTHLTERNIQQQGMTVDT